MHDTESIISHTAGTFSIGCNIIYQTCNATIDNKHFHTGYIQYVLCMYIYKRHLS